VHKKDDVCLFTSIEEYYNFSKKYEDFSICSFYLFFIKNGIIAKECKEAEDGFICIFYNNFNPEELDYLSSLNENITEKSLKNTNIKRKYEIYKKILKYNCEVIPMYYNNFLCSLNIEYSCGQIL
jgi:hypothetical protein